MKVIITTAFLFLLLHLSAAQAPSDSLLQQIRHTANDSLLAHMHRQAGLALKKEGKLEQAISQYQQALAGFKKLGDRQQQGKCYNNLGSVYTAKGDLRLALKSYQSSLQIYEELADATGQVKSHINLGNFYARQQQFQKAESHYARAIGFLDPEDLKNSALLNMNLGGIHSEANNPDGNLKKALEYYQVAAEAFARLGDTYNLAGIANNIGVVKEQQYELQEAYSSYYKALELRQQLQDLQGIAQSYYNLGNIKRMQGAHRQADKFYTASLDAAKAAGVPDGVLKALHNLSWNYSEMEQHQKAYTYRLKYDMLKDSLFNAEKSRQLAELETKYETEKKDRELQVKEASIRQKTAERNSTMITLALTIILSIAIMVVYHQRQRAMAQLALKEKEIHGHQISEMLKEQEIKSIHAMLEGQDRERKRIAEDLHDRLGSTLSAVKLHLGALDGVAVQPTAQPIYQNLNGLLDQAVSEVRDIAYNMVSGVLTKFGLVPALQDLKESLEASRQLKIELVVFNLEERLDGQVEVTLYRIIQELVSNVLKHARATEITIQLNKINQELLLMVEDNGRGFDPYLTTQNKGMGLGNVASRVASLGGRLSIDSGKGRGTTTTIEIPLT